MKYTLFLTHRCNLACDYCYVSKSSDCMSLSVAQRVIDFAFQNTPPADDIEIGFFGGEPLLEFPLLRDVTRIVRSHPSFDPCRVTLGLGLSTSLSRTRRPRMTSRSGSSAGNRYWNFRFCATSRESFARTRRSTPVA